MDRYIKYLKKLSKNREISYLSLLNVIYNRAIRQAMENECTYIPYADNSDNLLFSFIYEVHKYARDNPNTKFVLDINKINKKKLDDFIDKNDIRINNIKIVYLSGVTGLKICKV